jgi:stage II sporulation protein AA (anti-sigma F factor antagonist)
VTDSTNEDTSPRPLPVRSARPNLNWALRMADERIGAVLVLILGGRVSAAEAHTLQARLDAADAAGDSRLVVDLADVDYVSSSGLAVLEAASTRFQAADGALVLCEVPDPVRIVLELTGLTERLAIEGTRGGAIDRAARRGRHPAPRSDQTA